MNARDRAGCAEKERDEEEDKSPQLEPLSKLATPSTWWMLTGERTSRGRDGGWLLRSSSNNPLKDRLKKHDNCTLPILVTRIGGPVLEFKEYEKEPRILKETEHKI